MVAIKLNAKCNRMVYLRRRAYTRGKGGGSRRTFVREDQEGIGLEGSRGGWGKWEAGQVNGSHAAYNYLRYGS